MRRESITKKVQLLLRNSSDKLQSRKNHKNLSTYLLITNKYEYSYINKNFSQVYDSNDSF